MGILEFPRIHFRGDPKGAVSAAVPTANNDNDGSVDIGTLNLYMDKQLVGDDVTPAQFQKYQITVIISEAFCASVNSLFETYHYNSELETDVSEGYNRYEVQSTRRESRRPERNNEQSCGYF